MPTSPDSLLLSPDDVAKALGISRANTTRLIATGELPSVKLGRLRRVRRADLEAFVGALS